MALFIEDDGGLSASGISRPGGCCFARALAIVTGEPFADCWNVLAACNAITKPYQIVGHHPSAFEGIGKRNLDAGTVLGPALLSFMRMAGFTYTEVPENIWLDCDHAAFETGRIVVCIRDHAFAMIGGVIHDAFDPQTLDSYKRYGVYRYWRWWPLTAY